MRADLQKSKMERNPVQEEGSVRLEGAGQTSPVTRAVPQAQAEAGSALPSVG